MQLPGVSERQARWATLIMLAIWTVVHVYWIYRTGVNWDEFALLARAHESLAEGKIVSGGRPGLATILLMPLVEGCENTLSTVHRARLLWTPFGLGILAGFWLLLLRLFENRPYRARDALVGVALLALLPAFLKYSVQVRTDQPAIMFGLFGGVVLLASRRKSWLALLAGALLGVGYLSSQKLIYVAALAGLLGVADVFVNDRFRLGRDLARAGLVVAGGLAMLFLFRAVVAVFSEPGGALDMGGQMNVFAYYRRTIGYSYYVQMLPGLAVPFGMSLLTLGASGMCLRRKSGLEIGALVFGVFVLGLAVAGFHAGAFPYFWLTLGLFPATTVACGLPLLREVLATRTRRRLYVFLGAAFLVTAATDAVKLSADGQKLQRETQAFVSENFSSDAPGFHTTRAFFCRREAGFPTYFGQSIYFSFMTGPEAERERRIDEFLRRFREAEVAFIVRTFRLQQFPQRILEFWQAHYVPYRGPLLVPGFDVGTARNGPAGFEVIVPGAYRLHATDGSGRIEIAGQTLSHGASIDLEKGTYEVRATGVSRGSLLTLDLPTPPGPTTSNYYSSF